MAVATFTKSGSKATTAAKLDKTVFGVMPENHELLNQAYTAYLANGRLSSATTKNRGEVSGGGRKPWRQKGTGRARFGSIRNPIWRGGGVVFGPKGNENYTHKLHVGAKRLAIRQALSVAAEANKLIVIEALEVKDGKTATVAKLLNKIGADRNTLIVVEDKTSQLVRATRNLPNVKLTHAKYINVFDTLNADYIVMTKGSLDIVTEWLGGTK